MQYLNLYSTFSVEIHLKNGTVFVKKASIISMISLEQKKHLLIQIQLFQSQAVFVLNVFAKFE